MSDIPAGYCHCGCGQKTQISTKNHKKYGWIKGQPVRFVNGHNRRKDKTLNNDNKTWQHFDFFDLTDYRVRNDGIILSLVSDKFLTPHQRGGPNSEWVFRMGKGLVLKSVPAAAIFQILGLKIEITKPWIAWAKGIAKAYNAKLADRNRVKREIENYGINDGQARAWAPKASALCPWESGQLDVGGPGATARYVNPDTGF